MSCKQDVPVVASDGGLMTTKEFAARLCVHTNTVRHWRKTGQLLPASQTIGGHARYSEEQLAEHAAIVAQRQADEEKRVLRANRK